MTNARSPSAQTLIEAGTKAASIARCVQTVSDLRRAGELLADFGLLIATTPYEEQLIAQSYVSPWGEALPSLVEVFEAYVAAGKRVAGKLASGAEVA